MGGILVDDDLDGQIRAAQFAHPAADAVFRPDRDSFVEGIQLENFGRAETDADTAALAPIAVDQVLFEFFLRHIFSVNVILSVPVLLPSPLK